MSAALEDPAEPTLMDLLAQLATIQGKFANLATIEQAKGALMVTYGLSADAAFDLLRFHSQTRNVKLRAIAAELTSALSSSPTSREAISQLDRLIDDVTGSLQSASGARLCAAESPVTIT